MVIAALVLAGRSVQPGDGARPRILQDSSGSFLHLLRPPSREIPRKHVEPRKKLLCRSCTAGAVAEKQGTHSL